MASSISANNSTPGNGTWTVRPPAGASWKIRNVSASGAFKMQTTDGTNVSPLDAETSTLWVSNMDLSISNEVYLQIVDTSGNPNAMHYDGEAEPSSEQAFFL